MEGYIHQGVGVARDEVTPRLTLVAQKSDTVEQ